MDQRVHRALNATLHAGFLTSAARRVRSVTMPNRKSFNSITEGGPPTGNHTHIAKVDPACAFMTRRSSMNYADQKFADDNRRFSRMRNLTFGQCMTIVGGACVLIFGAYFLPLACYTHATVEIVSQVAIILRHDRRQDGGLACHFRCASPLGGNHADLGGDIPCHG
jgi:hypothetical protein